jgi:signal transduction histidine kinase/DNA-binding NarL/FixJ family response regulator
MEHATTQVKKSTLWERLSAPHPSITDLEQRCQSRLLNMLIIALVMLMVCTFALGVKMFGSVTFTLSARGREVSALFVLILAVLPLGILYVFNRVGKYKLSAYAFVILFFVVYHLRFFLLPATATSDFNRTDLVIFVFLFSSILLTARATMILFIASVGLHVYFLSMGPTSQLGPTGISLTLTITTTVVMLIFRQHRTRLEREQRAELEAVNVALRESEQHFSTLATVHKRTEDELQKNRVDFEELVQERTVALQRENDERQRLEAVNVALRESEQRFSTLATVHKRTEDELQKNRVDFEELVQERTVALQRENDERKRAETWLLSMNEQLQEEIAVRKNVEKELQQAKDAAEFANRAKSQFLANMSHELRTPLNAILGFSQLLERDPQLSSIQREYLDIINRSGEHLLMLINDILDLATIEAGKVVLKPRSFDLYQTLTQIEDMFRGRIERKRLQFLVERAADLPQYVTTDEQKLRQILMNLISNAVKFTKEGSITLRARPLKIEDLQLTIETPQTMINNQQSIIINLQFEVEDTGIGMSPEELDHIFTPFGQTASGRHMPEGTGLGLAISRQFVELMGGVLTVSSHKGTGSLFRFTIQGEPGEPTLLKPHMRRQVVGLAPGQPTYRILIAEDDEFSQTLLHKLLQSVGFEVQDAVNGQEALEVFTRWEPHFIWMDLRLPVMDGYEATRQIREVERQRAEGKGQEMTGKEQSATGERQEEDTINPSPLALRSIPIIGLTASAFEEHREHALAAGCNGFIRKPFKETEIFEMMAKYLGVSYIYKEDKQQTVEGKGMELYGKILPLTPELLAALPPDLFANLKRAAEQLNPFLLSRTIEEIRTHNGTLAAALAALAYNFNYKEILAVIERVKKL